MSHDTPCAWRGDAVGNGHTSPGTRPGARIMSLQTIDLTPRIGTELKTDAATLAEGHFGGEIRELLERRGVLVVRGIHMTSEQQLAFSRSIGKVQPQGQGGVFKITIDPDINPGAEYVKGAFFWHIDGATDDVPNLAAPLNPQNFSSTGGSTHFANTYAA